MALSRDKSMRMVSAVAEACDRGQCVLVVGSAFTQMAGLPSHRTFMDELLRHVPKRAALAFKRTQTSPEGLVAEFVGSELDRKRIIEIAARLYGDVAESAPFSDALRDLGAIPFSSAISLSWDDALVDIFRARNPLVITGVESDHTRLEQDPSQFAVIKLRGSVDAETFRLTDDDSRSATRQNTRFARTIVSRAQNAILFFFGLSVSELESFFTATPLDRGELLRSYAVVPCSAEDRLKATIIGRRFNVEIQPTGIRSGFSTLRSWATRIRKAAASRRGLRVPTPPRVLRVSKLELDNIAGFEHLELAFSSLTVMIGNNGLGKSTLLRAIALGLVGDHPDAMPMAKQLLRVGETTGRITLHVGKSIYRTQLIREDDAVRVESRQFTPLQRGAWTVLGFPAVRGVTGMKATRTSVESTTRTALHDPNVSDVLPLLYGGVDQRLDDLKAWIIFLRDYDRNRDRARAQIRSFFSIVAEFLVDNEIELADVNAPTEEILVKTRDGVVPIEQISQGMTSLFSWIGTILKRLYEVNPEHKRPERAPAVILVDELDAHLHPDWQRRLLITFKRHFPNAQLIGTTHSPLVIASAEANEVFVARRHDGGAVTFQRPQIAFDGFRADQILTSPLFGLSTTRSESSRSSIDRYAELLGKEHPTPNEEDELDALRAKLSTTLKSGETEIERRAEEALSKTLDAASDIAEVRSKISERARVEIRRQLSKLETAAQVGEKKTQPPDKARRTR